MLGGRAAEEIVYGTRTTGAENDIEQATELARSMVTRWGMSDALGMVQLAPRENPYLGGASRLRRRQAVQRGRPPRRSTPRCSASSTRATRRPSGCCADHRKQLDALAEALLARETLDEQEILEVTGLPPAPPLEQRVVPDQAQGGLPAPRE